MEKFTQNDLCYADISNWIKIEKPTDILDLEEKNITNPEDTNYILNKNENNQAVIDNFNSKNSRGGTSRKITITPELKKKFIEDIPYDIYVKNSNGDKYKPEKNSWRVNFVNILSEYLSKIKLGTKWETSMTKKSNYNHELQSQLFIDKIKSKNPDNITDYNFDISSNELEQYRNDNLYTFNDIKEDSYFEDSINGIFYYVDLGFYSDNDNDRIDSMIRLKLLEGLEKLKNELSLSINIDDILLDKILENFKLETLKIELNNENINETHFYDIYQNILNIITKELNEDNYRKYYNVIKKILNIVVNNYYFIAKIIKKNIFQYEKLINNMQKLDYSDNRVIGLMDKIKSDLQKESGYSCSYRELTHGLMNLISSFQENETSTVYDPSFIIIDNIDELDDESLLHYDESNTVSPECRNSNTPSTNPYKYIKDNITPDKCYEDRIINIYNNGNTIFDNDIKDYINKKINNREINSYYTEHLNKIKSKDTSNTEQNSIKNYNCMIDFLENNTNKYNISCHNENDIGGNNKKDSIIEDTDFIPSKYIIDEILPNYIYYLKSHITDENRCLYYYDSIDETSRVTMDKFKDLPDLTSLPLTDSTELTIQTINYGKIGTEFGKYGEIGTEIGKYGLIGNEDDYNNYIKNKQCGNIVTKIIDNINKIKDEKIKDIPSIKIDTSYIDILKQNFDTQINKINERISNNETHFSNTRPYKDYSNIVFTKTDVNTINNGNYTDITTLLRYKIDLEKIDKGDIEEYIYNNTDCPNNKPNQCRGIIINNDITINNTITTFNLYDFYTNTIKEDHYKQMNIVVSDYIRVDGQKIYYKISNIYNDYPVNFQDDFTDFPQEKIYSFDEWINKNIIITDLTKEYYFKIKDGNADVYYVLNIDRNNDNTNSPKEENLLYQYVNQYNNDKTLASLTNKEQCIGTEFISRDGKIKSENPCTINGAECKEFGYRYIQDNFNNIKNLNNDRNTWINNNFITDYNEIYKLSTGLDKLKDDLQNTDANYWRNKYKSGNQCLTNDEGSEMKDSEGNYKVNPNYNYGLKWYYFSNSENDLPQDSIIINISNIDRIFNKIISDDDIIDLIDSQEIVEFIDENDNSIQMDVIDENYYLKLTFDNGTSKYYKVNGSNKCLNTQVCNSKTNTNYRDEYNSHINEIITDDEYCDILNKNYGYEGNNSSYYEHSDIQKTRYHLHQNTDYNSLIYYPGNYDENYTLN